MAIDGRVVGLRVIDGEHKLTLEGRKAGEEPGQVTLVVENPPTDAQELEVFIGKELWGGSGFLMHKDTKIADRTGYVGIRLVDQWREVLTASEQEGE